MYKSTQLFFGSGVLLDVSASAETSRSHSVSFTYPQDNLPTQVEASRVSGAFSPLVR